MFCVHLRYANATHSRSYSAQNTPHATNGAMKHSGFSLFTCQNKRAGKSGHGMPRFVCSFLRALFQRNHGSPPPTHSGVRNFPTFSAARQAPHPPCGCESACSASASTQSLAQPLSAFCGPAAPFPPCTSACGDLCARSCSLGPATAPLLQQLHRLR